MPKGVWRVVSEGSSSGQFGPKWALAVLHAVLPLVSNQGLGQFSVTVRVMGRSRGFLLPCGPWTPGDSPGQPHWMRSRGNMSPWPWACPDFSVRAFPTEEGKEVTASQPARTPLLPLS